MTYRWGGRDSSESLDSDEVFCSPLWEGGGIGGSLWQGHRLWHGQGGDGEGLGLGRGAVLWRKWGAGATGWLWDLDPKAKQWGWVWGCFLISVWIGAGNHLLLPIKTQIFSLPGTLSPSFLVLTSTPLPLPGITSGPLSLSSSSLLLSTFIASRRGLALPIEDLPVIISFQSPIFNIQFTIQFTLVLWLCLC